MRLVLDSNEYILGLDNLTIVHPSRLLRFLADNAERFDICASRVIVEEVRRNLPEVRFKDFWAVIAVLDVTVLEDWDVSFSLREKYQAMGLKTGDAAIAACAEAAGAEAVITENRDFHGRAGLSFRALRAEEFLKEQAAGDSSA
ncbi:MAG: PIN domain-containing protein [Candidatus Coatesbacteria bacterium]